MGTGSMEAWRRKRAADVALRCVNRLMVLKRRLSACTAENECWLPVDDELQPRAKRSGRTRK